MNGTFETHFTKSIDALVAKHWQTNRADKSTESPTATSADDSADDSATPPKAQNLIPDAYALTKPKALQHGDATTNIAMRLAKKLKTNPMLLAQDLANALSAAPEVKLCECAPPGFVNIFFKEAELGAIVSHILAAEAAWGSSNVYSGRKINLEFVSANPTGPIHIGGARWAAYGDSLARILQFCGADVTKEYYFNDHGTQIDHFGHSVYCAYTGQDTPPNGYAGEYVIDIARQIKKTHAEANAALPAVDLAAQITKQSVELMFETIKSTLKTFDVNFDVYTHENSIFAEGYVQQAINKLSSLGHIYKKDGATWVQTTPFGDDKDRVIVKKDNSYTYFAGDLGYYLHKRSRGFEECVLMLGADHHGYIKRLYAICAALGDTPGCNMQVLIGQMVRIMQNGQPLRMSKRAGNVLTLDDLLEYVGKDAARYALVRSSPHTPLDIDVDLLIKHSNTNPVYYVQYSHARTCSVTRLARQASIDPTQFNAADLSHHTEKDLLNTIKQFPEVVRLAAAEKAPHKVVRFLEDFSSKYNRWYDSCRVIPRAQDDSSSSLFASRYCLNIAAGITLRNGLALLGVCAPERM